MDDFRIGSLDFNDYSSNEFRDGSKKRSKQRPVAPQESEDQVVLSSSDADSEDELPGYLPGSSDEE